MPGQGAAVGGDLTDDEVLAVVCHERYDLGGADPQSDAYVEEFEHWCSDESPIYEALEAGTTLADLADAGVVDADGEPIEIMPDRRRAGRGIAARVSRASRRASERSAR